MASAVLACGLTAVGGTSDDAGAGADASFVETGTAPDTDTGSDVTAPDVVTDGAVLDAAPDADATALDADADAAVLDAGPTTAVGATTVAATSLTVDLASPGDGTIATDGQKDGVFVVAITGPAIALTIIRTDSAGAPTSNQQWDTWVGSDAIPAALGTVFTLGSSTYQLGVYDNGGVLLNDAAGRVKLLAGQQTLRVAGASVGSFVAGNHFRLVAQRPDGTLVRGPVVTY